MPRPATTPSPAFLDALKTLKTLPVTQESLARLLRITRITIYNWREGNFYPTPKKQAQFVKLVRVLKQMDDAGYLPMAGRGLTAKAFAEKVSEFLTNRNA